MVKSSFNLPFEGDFRNLFPILVTGLPGVPGYNAFFYLRALFGDRVLGLAPPHLPALAAAPGTVVLDAEDAAALDKLFVDKGIRSVLDASGWCALKPAECDASLARRLNLDVGVNLMRSARVHGARLVRLSTDLVFDGLRGNYREEDPVSPVTVYGKVMAEAEAAILSGYPEAAVLRVALPMGPSFNGHAGAIDWIESRFRKGRPATLYYDEVRSNLYVQDLNRALLHFLQSDARGLFHVGGPLALSLNQIGQVINRVGDYDPELLMGCLRAEAGPLPPRAGDVSMDSSKALALLPPGILSPWPFSADLVPSDRSWHRRRETRFPSGSVAPYLYGTGWPEAWDHPLRLIPKAFLIKFPQMEASSV